MNHEKAPGPARSKRSSAARKSPSLVRTARAAGHGGKSLQFTPSKRLTVGVEWELGFVDRGTRDLTPAAPDVLEQLGPATSRIKPEIFQSMN